MMNIDFELALEELERDIQKGIDKWADAHITTYKQLDHPSSSLPGFFRILGEYYKAYKEDRFIPCELTFRIWYHMNYERQD